MGRKEGRTCNLFVQEISRTLSKIIQSISIFLAVSLSVPTSPPQLRISPNKPQINGTIVNNTPSSRPPPSSVTKIYVQSAPNALRQSDVIIGAVGAPPSPSPDYSLEESEGGDSSAPSDRRARIKHVLSVYDNVHLEEEQTGGESSSYYGDNETLDRRNDWFGGTRSAMATSPPVVY